MNTHECVELALRRVEDGWHMAADGAAQVDAAVLAEEVWRLTAERDAALKDAEELRLTLLAEQGDAGGALSTDWSFDARGWWDAEGCGFASKIYRADTFDGWEWVLKLFFESRTPIRGRETTARSAMIAVNERLLGKRRAACIARVRQLQSQSVILWPPNGAHQQTPAIMLDRLTDPNLTEAVLAVYEAVL